MRLEWSGVRVNSIALGSLMVAAIAMTGCSRMSFILPDAERKGFERTAPEVQMQPDDRKEGSIRAQRLLAEGQQKLAQGDLAAAQKAAVQSVRLAPSSPQAHTLLALVEDRRGNARVAGQHYLRATELAPGQGGMLNNYGTWICAQGRHMESLEWFDRALADPGYSSQAAVALANAGACAHRAGDDRRAGPYLLGAIELDPTNPVALGVMAEREYRAGNAFRARAFSQRRLASAPADAAALLLASQIEEKLGDNAAAARYVQQIRTEFPTTLGTEPGDGGER